MKYIFLGFQQKSRARMLGRVGAGGGRLRRPRGENAQAYLALCMLTRHINSFLIYVNPSLLRLVSWFQVFKLFNHIISLSRILRHTLTKSLHQVQSNKPFTQFAQLMKQICIRSKGQAWKIDLEKTSISHTIGR